MEQDYLIPPFALLFLIMIATEEVNSIGNLTIGTKFRLLERELYRPVYVVVSQRLDSTIYKRCYGCVKYTMPKATFVLLTKENE